VQQQQAAGQLLEHLHWQKFLVHVPVHRPVRDAQ
jgi:hypothetical protein